MDLLKTFLKKLATQDEQLRLLDVEKLLKDRMKNLTLTEFAKKYSINSGTLSHMLKGDRAIPINMIDLTNYKSKIIGIAKNCTIPIEIPRKFNYELSYLIGLLRDGTVNKDKEGECCCNFYSKDKEFLEKVGKLIKNLFNIPIKISSFGDVYGIRIRSKTMYLFFKLLFDIPQRQVDWQTPRLIKRANQNIKQAYISGFWDAEGGCPHIEKKIVKRKNIYVKFAQKNKESLEFIKNTLEKEGIKSGRIHWNESKWILKIRIKDIPLFSSYINPLHPKKQKRLEMLTKLLNTL